MKLLRAKQVLGLIPVCQSTLWQWVKDGKFPQPVRLGTRCTVWREDEVREFIETSLNK